MPSFLGGDQLLINPKLSGTKPTIHDLKIVGLANAVEGRINLNLNNGQVCKRIIRAFFESDIQYCFYRSRLLIRDVKQNHMPFWQSVKEISECLCHFIALWTQFN